ncbi:unnamed protein product [Cylicocyclus nassatus]|uniref:alpha-1,6-mannosyl-glycoprotein 6-beta-N-acetylglucosaminyltransferase n=1 Tax=Cylicocyclus nassatus TaxID=53992 RepID=A0AA36H390_CYLNA|nr:unnamed protein product [Cylicocyclus nassatus]
MPYSDKLLRRIPHFKCRIRLLDSFGTHIEFSDSDYYNKHKTELGGKGNAYGGIGLQLLQHWTFFPHTPDNDFLGFAVHSPDVKPFFERGSHERPASLVYGKAAYMWNNKDGVLDVLKNLTEVHATVADAAKSKTAIFVNVTNHGILTGVNIASLLKSVDIFMGLGFPIEGPAPLEALANGAVFINAKFTRL